jgi:hypothetical protein
MLQKLLTTTKVGLVALPPSGLTTWNVVEPTATGVTLKEANASVVKTLGDTKREKFSENLFFLGIE